MAAALTAGRGWRLALAVPPVVLVLALAAAEAAGWPFLQGPLQRALSVAAGVPVSLQGSFRAHLLWRPHIEVDRLLVAPAGGAAVPHLLDARQALLAWRWVDAWRWWRGDGLRIEALVVGALDAHLVRGADGRASWQIGASRQAAAQPALPRFGRLELQRGTLHVDDRMSALQLEVGLGTVTPTEVTLAATGHYRQFAVSARGRADGPLPLIAGDDPQGSVHLVADLRVGRAHVAYDGRVAALLGARWVDGALQVSGPSLAALGAPLHLTLPTTAAFALRGHVGHAGGLWTLRAEQATIGKSRLAGAFVFDPRPRPPLLRGSLTGPLLALADLGPVVGAPVAASAASAAPTATRRVLPSRRFDLPSLRAMDADVDVAIDTLDFGSALVAPMQTLRTQVRLAGGVLTLNALQARLAGGTVAGSSRLDATGEPAAWQADLQLAGLDIARWLRRLQASPGGSHDKPPTLVGALSGHLQVHGNGRSTAEILGTLDGRAQLQLHGGSLSHLATELAGLDVAQALGVALVGDKPLPLRCAFADLDLKQGVATVRNAVLDNSDSTIRIGGQFSLRDETLALKATVFPKDKSPFTLRSPLLVEGRFAAPSVHLQMRGLGARALAAAALAALLPPAALLAFVDVGAPPAADPCSGVR